MYVCGMTVSEVSGGSFNPARSLAPSLVAAKMGDFQFILFTAPLVGSGLATIVYNSIFVDDHLDKELKESQENIESENNEAETTPLAE